MTIELKSLVQKLCGGPRRALEAAAGLAVSRTHADVELEHWLLKMLEDLGGEVQHVLRSVGVDDRSVTAGLERVLATFKTGHNRRPSLASDIDDILREAWMLGSIAYGHQRIRSGVLFLAMLQNRTVHRRLSEFVRELQAINVEALTKALPQVIGASSEAAETAGSMAGPAPIGGSTPGAGGSATPALDQFTKDLTAAAKAGKLDPVLGRDGEIRQIVDILSRRRQNNPILTGEPGVGKTAIVEGFALRIAQKDVPAPLQNVVVRVLDLGLLQAGAGVKGEFENRLRQVMEEVRSSPQPIILFIDEAHTLIGAGGEAGQNDAANLLKPALARGELRTIAATTWAEYKKYFEKDAALTRRFQVVKVEEPDEAAALAMMRGVAASLEQHHGVRILDDALVESVRLSQRYIPARQLPDKSVSVLDTACARVTVAKASTPPAIEDLRRRLEVAATERARLQRECDQGIDHRDRLAKLDATCVTDRAALQQLEQRWRDEVALIEQIDWIVRDIDAAMVRADGAVPDAKRSEALRQDLGEKQAALARMQGDQPLLHHAVTGQTVAEIIGSWTGIPVGRMVADQVQTVLDLVPRLEQRVLGQRPALEAIGKRIRTSRAKLDDPNRPVGVFLLVGPSGVGKTETAAALAETLYGGERNLVTINMSEYQEPHTVSTLRGSPPGYIGYGEGGVLTEAVRRRPYTVVLLDEVEKAHADVMEVFYQVFDKGKLEDGEGRQIDFKNTILLLTSNVGTDLTMKLSADPETVPTAEAMATALKPELLRHFPAALLGRLVVVPYFPIARGVLEAIVRLQVGRIERRVRDNLQTVVKVSEGAIAAIADRCTDAESGARNVQAILTNTLLPMVANEVLARMAERQPIGAIGIDVDASGQFTLAIA